LPWNIKVKVLFEVLTTVVLSSEILRLVVHSNSTDLLVKHVASIFRAMMVFVLGLFFDPEDGVEIFL
jgi:hypothetical protein